MVRNVILDFVEALHSTESGLLHADYSSPRGIEGRYAGEEESRFEGASSLKDRDLQSVHFDDDVLEKKALVEDFIRRMVHHVDAFKRIILEIGNASEVMKEQFEATSASIKVKCELVCNLVSEKELSLQNDLKALRREQEVISEMII